MLERMKWIFVVCFFFLFLLNKQAGQTFISYLEGPRTEAEVSQTHQIDHAYETNTGHHIHWLSPWNHSLWWGKAAHCPSSSSQPDPPQYKWFSHILQIPHSSFFHSLSHFQLATSLLSISTLSCLKPFNGVNWWGNNGADRRDQSNLHSICIWVKEKQWRTGCWDFAIVPPNWFSSSQLQHYKSPSRFQECRHAV